MALDLTDAQEAAVLTPFTPYRQREIACSQQSNLRSPSASYYKSLPPLNPVYHMHHRYLVQTADPTLAS